MWGGGLQDKKGTFRLVVLATDLERFGITAEELEVARAAGGIYPLLHAKRTALFAAESERRREDIKRAKALHDRSVAYQGLLLDRARTHAPSAAKAATHSKQILVFHPLLNLPVLPVMTRLIFDHSASD